MATSQSHGISSFTRLHKRRFERVLRKHPLRVQGASLEGANLEGVVFDGAVLDGAYFTETVVTAKSVKGATFNDALIPQKALDQLCKRADVKGSDTTKESLMCP